MTLKILGRQYQCAAWHVIQAEEFVRALGQLPNAEFHVYGEGLIAWALRKNRELCPTLGLRANHVEVERG